VAQAFANLTLSPRQPSSSLAWASIFALGLIALQVLPEAGRALLWYTRDGIAAGEYWRFVTGNLVHVNAAHLALNIGALLIGIWVFYAARTPVGWIVAQLVCSLATNLGLWWFSPDVPWCIGMSGALHGLLIIGAVDFIRSGDRLGWALLAIWIGKLAWEQASGPLPFSTDTVGAAVIVDAHLWGAIGGAVYLLLEAGLARAGLRL
jgi:rhomboid family GlyGly-CTERM serine protease